MIDRDRLDILCAQAVGESILTGCDACEGEGWDDNPDGLTHGPGEGCCTACGGTGRVVPPMLVPDPWERDAVDLEAFMAQVAIPR